jgi:kynureninase
LFSDYFVEGRESEEVAYFCGNSLGLQPKETRKLLTEELDVWSHKYRLALLSPLHQLLILVNLNDLEL